ncbi:MAG: hypothetical protein HY721_32005 [Planctomycetes bacterium]|nr:hypothetical protein [Planctomycetota bacterium]
MRCPARVHRACFVAFATLVFAVPRAAARGEEKASRPLLKLEPLCVAPRDAPGSQLVRLRVEGAAPAQGGPLAARVKLPGRAAVDVTGAPVSGDQPSWLLAVPGVEREDEVTVSVASLGAEASAKVVLRRLRPWKLFLVQHTHTDIGYTDHPSRLNVDHLQFIDDAVRACALTDSYPEPARFRWTCEATWAVERYLRERSPDRVADLVERVRQGRIEVTAMCMNMTDLATEEVVCRSFYPLQRIQALGIGVRSAMQCDVNGYPWMLPELLQDLGVTGFAGGINHTRSTLPFEHPRAIAWESPGGGSVLAWRGEHYMFANMLGFRDSVDKVLERLPGYLLSLERRGYPYEAALCQMAGYHTDNAAPCYRASDLVREWNDRYAVPEVRMATLSEFLDAARASKDGPPRTRQAWPDWWADGVGSAAIEASVVRAAQERLAFAETYLALARAAKGGVPDLRASFAEAYLLACLYDEHTFGAAESVDRPHTINTKLQWSEKSTHAHRASWIATELEAAALAAWAEEVLPQSELGAAVFNSLSWERTGPVRVRVPRSIVDDGTPFRIVDPETGEEVPYQAAGGAPNWRDFEIVASRVPSVGYRTYRIEPGKAPAPVKDPFVADGPRLSNGLTRVELDPARAAIAAIHPAESRESIVGAAAPHGFNQYVHERIVHKEGRSHLWPPAAAYDPASFAAEGAASAKLEPGASGPVRRSLKLRSKINAPAGEVSVESEVSLYRGLPGVYIANRVEKPDCFDSEGCYFAFPFGAQGPPRAEVAGGVMRPGADQIPGSASDWHMIQRWVRVPGGGRDAVWATVDAPLVQFGGLNTGRWGKGLTLERPLVYSWVMNNYWFTNFVASQRGHFTFRYAVAGGEAAASDVAADRFGREACSPLVAAVAAGRGTGPKRRSLLGVEPPEVALVAVKEAEAGAGALVLRLRNRSGAAVEAKVRLDPAFGARSATRASVIEEDRGPLPVTDGAARVAIGPFGLATVVLRR